MLLEGTGTLLRVFLGEADRYDGKPLHEAIMLAAREVGLAGVTILRGVEGYGARSRIHTAKLLRFSEDLPLVVEVIDTEEKIQAFVPRVNEMFERSGCGGLVTMEKVNIIRYTSGRP